MAKAKATAAKNPPAVSGAGEITLKTRLTREQQLELHRLMVLNREFDNKISLLYRRGLVIGAAFSSLGQEATSCASAYALEKGDIIAPMIRNAGATLVRGLPPRDFLANYMYRVNSPTGGRDGNTHMGDLRYGIIAPISMLGASIALCSGFVLAARQRGEKRVALTWIGEGSTSTGEFHEDVNFAAVMKAPLVVIIENNQYAYSTPVKQQCLAERFADKAQGYGIKHAVTIDGNDPIAVYETTKEAVDRARAGEGTQMFEVLTYRRKGHAEHDPAKYVPKEIQQYWEGRDPLTRYEAYLKEMGYADDASIAKVYETLRAEIEAAEEWVMKQPKPDPATVMQGVYADQRHPAHMDDEFLYGRKYH
ncbi:MAG: thiamine pyrophosphate-dependent dehydrogenase E1 component subunit alpha [Planctomycetaceae bacterium]|nr:thiamine pyrophosphate-dependent dehydrogenase E1 component subunit alpha [Planctomycetaceae bacterium]